MPNKTPIIITAFANKYFNGEHLPHLSKEINAVNNSTKALQLKTFFEVITLFDATWESIVEALQNKDYQDRIVAFHYGGHASGKELMLQTTSGNTQLADANNLAELLGRQERLQLVFLNGCSTKGQVEELMKQDIPYIIATDRSIDDWEATRFAIRFYEALKGGERNISKLFQEAEKALKEEKLQERVERRLYSSQQKSLLGELAWGLYQLEGTESEDLGEWFVNQNVAFLTPAPPEPPKAFVGRQSDLKTVHQLLKDNDNVVLVNGIGGIGKSTLAQAYWHKHQHQYNYIAWLTVINNNVQEAFINSDLETKLKIKVPEKSTLEERYKIIQTKLSELKGINLLILDNINEPDAVHQFELPNWKAMVTSRANISHYIHHTVGLLNMVDAKTLFLSYFPQAKQQMEVLEKLLEAIGRHTLTIELLAKTLRQLRGMGYGLTELYTDLEERGLLNPTRTQEIYTDYKKGKTVKFEELIAVIFDIQDLSDYKQWLLLQFAVLPSIYISFNDISDFLQIEGDKGNEFGNALNGLVRKGWLEDGFDEEKGVRSFKLHQVVQEVVRKKVEPTIEKCGFLVESFLQKLSKRKGENPLSKKHYVTFAYSFLIFSKSIIDNKIADLCNKTALIYQGLGYYQKALLLHKKAINMREQILNPKDFSLAQSYNNLGNVYYFLGDISQALKNYFRSLVIFEDILDNTDPYLASSYANIGMCFNYLANYTQSIEYQRKAINIRERVLEKNHPALASSYNNIGATFHALGDFNKSLKFYLKAINIREQVLEKQHPLLASCYNNIGKNYEALGKYDKALHFHFKTLEIFKNTLNAKHPRLATCYSNIAGTFINIKEYEKSLFYNTKALELRENILHSKHPALATSYNSVGESYKYVGKYKEALDYQNKALIIRKEAFNHLHPDIAHSYNAIGSVYQYMGKYEKALYFYLKSTAIKEKIFNLKHPSLAHSYINIAILHYEMKNYKFAIKYINDSIEIIKYNFPNGHHRLYETLDWQQKINEALQNQKDQT